MIFFLFPFSLLLIFLFLFVFHPFFPSPGKSKKGPPTFFYLNKHNWWWMLLVSLVICDFMRWPLFLCNTFGKLLFHISLRKTGFRPCLQTFLHDEKIFVHHFFFIFFLSCEDSFSNWENFSPKIKQVFFKKVAKLALMCRDRVLILLIDFKPSNHFDQTFHTSFNLPQMSHSIFFKKR